MTYPTYTEGAAYLKVSRAYYVALIGGSKLPVLPTWADLEAFKAASDAERDAALAELARLTQELGDD